MAKETDPLDADDFPNQPPEFADQVFDGKIAENSEPGTLVGTLVANDPNRDNLTYTIITNTDPDQDGNGAFRIEGNLLLVNDDGDLDYERIPTLQIRARASDGEFSDDGLVTVSLTDDRQEDADGDGLTQAEEEDKHHTSDTDPDSDNDGFCDNRELAEGTDPNGPENFPAPPFPEDAARYVYFGGFDANFLDAHNTAWIFRAPVETVPTVAP